MLEHWVLQPRRADRLRWVVLAILGALLAVALLVIARRWAGALDRDLALVPLVLAAALATAITGGSRAAWRAIDNAAGDVPKFPPRWRLVVGWTGSAALILLAIGCCFPGHRAVVWLIWLPLLIGDQFWRRSFVEGSFVEGSFVEGSSGEGSVGEGGNLDSPTRAVLAAAAAGQHDIVQNLYRVRQPQGGEAIYGTLRADFQTGQRTATLHVGFCPPLGHAPQIEAEACDFPEAQVKVVQAVAHGVRLDVRLSEAAEEPCSVVIDLAARPSRTAVGDSRCDAPAAAV